MRKKRTSSPAASEHPDAATPSTATVAPTTAPQSSSDPVIDAAIADPQLRDRVNNLESSLRTSLAPTIETATRITKKTMASFPVRVWRHFLVNNGFLLSAGVSYQALFAVFAAIYLVIAVAGLALGVTGNMTQYIVELINRYIPGLVSDHGAITPEEITEIAHHSVATFGTTGGVALVVLAWTAIGWITFTRKAVRDTFDLAPDPRNYFLLKAKDFLAAVIFGAALMLGAALGSLATWAITQTFDALNWETSWVMHLLARIVVLAISFVVQTLALSGLFRFLSGASVKWRYLLPGSAMGAAGLVVLQLGANLLVSYTPSNPLLASFAIFIALMLWFRLNGIVTLVAASWIAVSASDRGISLDPNDKYQRELADYTDRVMTAETQLRDARDRLNKAPWYRRWRAGKELLNAQINLRDTAADVPQRPTHPKDKSDWF